MKNVNYWKKGTLSVLVISLLGILALSSSTTGVLPHVFATITYAQFSPSDNVVGTYTFYTVKFVLGTTATISNIVLTWPSGYNVATEKFVFNNGVPLGTTTATNGPPVTITYCFGSAACTSGGGTPTSESSGDVVTFMFANIENPTTAGSYTPTSICTYDLTTKVECTSSIPAITISDITSSDLASSISITALTAGTLSVTGTSSFTEAATFASTVTSTGLLTANGGINTTTLLASGAVTTTGLLTANGGISTPTISAPGGLTMNIGTGGLLITSGFGIVVHGNFFVQGGTMSLADDICDYNEVTISGAPCQGNFVVNYTNGNLYSTGSLDAANGLFQVNTAGQITTPSVNFNSFAGGATPIITADNETIPISLWPPVATLYGTTTGTIAPGRSSTAIVLITVDVYLYSASSSTFFLNLTSTIPGITISPQSPIGAQAFNVPSFSTCGGTFAYTVTGLTSSSSGTFKSTIWDADPFYLYDNYIQVILLPS